VRQGTQGANGAEGAEDPKAQQVAEAVWKALEAFEVSSALAQGSRPSMDPDPHAAAEKCREKAHTDIEHTISADFIEAQARAEKLLSQEQCKALLQSGGRLLTAAAYACCGGVQWPHTALARLPQLIARRVLHLSLAAVLPDLRERDRLRAKVEEMAAAQLSSTRTYLEELSVLRSHFRNTNQAPAWSIKRAGGNEAAKANFRLGPTDRYIWDVLESLPEDLRDLTCAVILEKLRCLSTQSHESVEAEITAFARRVAQAKSAGLRQEALAGEHDAKQEAEAELKRTQKELAKFKEAHQELQMRFRDQVAMIQSLTNENSALRSKASGRNDEEAETLRQAQFRVQHLEAELMRLRAEGSDEAKRLRSQLGEVQAQMNDLKEAARNKDRELRNRLSLLIPAGVNEEHVPSVDELIDTTLPNFIDRTSEVFGDGPATDWLRDSFQAVGRHLNEARNAQRSIEQERKTTERKAKTAQARITELEGLLSTEREARKTLEQEADKLREEVETLNKTLQQARFTSKRSELSAVSPKGEEGPPVVQDDGFHYFGIEEVEAHDHYKLLNTHFEELTALHEKLLGELEMLQTENAKVLARATEAEQAREETEALTSKELRDIKAQMTEVEAENDKLKQEIDDCERNQLHPARVAETLAELRHLKHEHQAALNANAVLRSSLEVLRQQVSEGIKPCRDSTDEKLKFTLGTCDRTVFNRLYEDAVRRHEKIAEILRAIAALPDEARSCFDQDLAEFEGLPGYTPFRVKSLAARSLSEPDIREMMVSNARDLGGQAAKPLFYEPLRLTTPRPEPERVLLETRVVSPNFSGPSAPPPASARGSPELGESSAAHRQVSHGSPEVRPTSAASLVGAGRAIPRPHSAAVGMASQRQPPQPATLPERPSTGRPSGSRHPRRPGIITAMESGPTPGARLPQETLLPSTRPKSADLAQGAWNGNYLPPASRGSCLRPSTAGSKGCSVAGGNGCRRRHKT